MRNPCLMRLPLLFMNSHQSHCIHQGAGGAFQPPSESDLLEEADGEEWVPSGVGVSGGHWEGGEEEAFELAVGSPLRYAGSQPCVGVEIQRGTCKNITGGFFCRDGKRALTSNLRIIGSSTKFYVT